jgi:hypothetical protein
VFGGIEEIGDSAFALIGAGVDSLIIDGKNLKTIGERAFAFRGNGVGDLVELDVEGSIPYENGVAINKVSRLYDYSKVPPVHLGYFGGTACLLGGRSWRSQEVALKNGTSGAGQPKVVDMRKMRGADVLKESGWTGYRLETDFDWERWDKVGQENLYSATRSNIDTKKYYGGRYGSTVKRMYLPEGLGSIMGIGLTGGENGTAAYGGCYWLDDGYGGGYVNGNGSMVKVPPIPSGHDEVGSRQHNFGIPTWYAYGAADTMLEYVELPTSLVSIGEDAFANCINVKFGVAGVGQTGDWTSLENLTNISPLAFLGCEDFTEVKLPEKCVDFASGNMGLQFAYSGLGKVKLAAGTKRISGRMFRGCKNLLKVNFNDLALPEGGIEEYAFDGCVTLGSKQVDRGEDDTTLVYQRGWGTMHAREFAGTGYKRLEVAGGYKGGKTPIDTRWIASDGDVPFYGCKNLKEVRLPKYWRVSGVEETKKLGDFEWPGERAKMFLNGVGAAKGETGRALGQVVLMDSEDVAGIGDNFVKAEENYGAAGYTVKNWYEVRLRTDRMPDKLVYGHGKGLMGDERLIAGIWDNWTQDWYDGPFTGTATDVSVTKVDGVWIYTYTPGVDKTWEKLFSSSGTSDDDVAGAMGGQNGDNVGIQVVWEEKKDGEGKPYWVMDIRARTDNDKDNLRNRKITGWWIRSSNLPVSPGMSVKTYKEELPDVYTLTPEYDGIEQVKLTDDGDPNMDAGDGLLSKGEKVTLRANVKLEGKRYFSELSDAKYNCTLSKDDWGGGEMKWEILDKLVLGAAAADPGDALAWNEYRVTQTNFTNATSAKVALTLPASLGGGQKEVTIALSEIIVTELAVNRNGYEIAVNADDPLIKIVGNTLQVVANYSTHRFTVPVRVGFNHGGRRAKDDVVIVNGTKRTVGELLSLRTRKRDGSNALTTGDYTGLGSQGMSKGDIWMGPDFQHILITVPANPLYATDLYDLVMTFDGGFRSDLSGVDHTANPIVKGTGYMYQTIVDMTSAPETFEYNGLRYEVIEHPAGGVGTSVGKARVIMGNSSSVSTYPYLSGEVTIPAKAKMQHSSHYYYTAWHEYQVVEIGTNAFRNSKNITEIELENPDDWTNIGSYAFYGCENLTKVEGLEKVKGNIGSFAFVGTKLAGDLTLNADTIEWSAFHKTQVTSVNWKPTVEKGVIRADAFSECAELKKVTLRSMDGSLSTIEVPEGTFRGAGVEELTVGKGVKGVAGSFDLADLKKVRFEGTGVAVKGEFGESKNLTVVEFEEVTPSWRLEKGTFAGVTNLKKMSWPVTPTLDGKIVEVFEGITDACMIYIPWNDLSNPEKMEDEISKWEWGKIGPTYEAGATVGNIWVYDGLSSGDITLQVYRDGGYLTSDNNPYWNPGHVGMDYYNGIWPVMKSGSWVTDRIDGNWLNGTRFSLTAKQEVYGKDTISVEERENGLGTRPWKYQGIKPYVFTFEVRSPVEHTVGVKDHERYHPEVEVKGDTVVMYEGEGLVELEPTVMYYGQALPDDLRPTILTKWTVKSGDENKQGTVYKLDVPENGKGAAGFTPLRADTLDFEVEATLNEIVGEHGLTVVIIGVDTVSTGWKLDGKSSVTTTNTTDEFVLKPVSVKAMGRDGKELVSRGLGLKLPVSVKLDYDEGGVKATKIEGKEEWTVRASKYQPEETGFAIGSNKDAAETEKAMLVVKRPESVVLKMDTLNKDEVNKVDGMAELKAGKDLQLAAVVELDGRELTAVEMETEIGGAGNGWIVWKTEGNVLLYEASGREVKVRPKDRGVGTMHYALSGKWEEKSEAVAVSVPQLAKTVKVKVNGRVIDGGEVTLPGIGAGSVQELGTAIIWQGETEARSETEASKLTWRASGNVDVVEENGVWKVKARPSVGESGPVELSGKVMATYEEIYHGGADFKIPAVSVKLKVTDETGKEYDASHGISLKKGVTATMKGEILVEGEVRNELTEGVTIEWEVSENPDMVNVSTVEGQKGRTSTLVPQTTGYDEYKGKIRVSGVGEELFIPVTIEAVPMTVELSANAVTVNLRRRLATMPSATVKAEGETEALDMPVYWKTRNEGVVKVVKNGGATQLEATGVGTTTVIASVDAAGTRGVTELSVTVPEPEARLWIGEGTSDVNAEVGVNGEYTAWTQLVVDGVAMDTGRVTWSQSPEVMTEYEENRNIMNFRPKGLSGSTVIRAKTVVEGREINTGNGVNLQIRKPVITFEVGEGEDRRGNTVYDTVYVGGEKELWLSVKMDGEQGRWFAPEVEWKSWDVLMTVTGGGTMPGGRDVANVSVLLGLPEADSVIITGKVKGTTDSLRYRMHVPMPEAEVRLRGDAGVVQVEDTLGVKASAWYGGVPVPVAVTYTWSTTAVEDTAVMVPTTETDSVRIAGKIGGGDTVKVIARSSLGGVDTFKVKVAAPIVTITPALGANETWMTLRAAKDTALSFTATTAEEAVGARRALSNGLRATAVWETSDEKRVYVTENGVATSRDTGRVEVTVSLAGGKAVREVRVPVPDMRLTISGATNAVSVDAGLQLSGEVKVDGAAVVPGALSDASVEDSLGMEWSSLDTIQPMSRRLLVSEEGMVTMPTGRQSGDSVRITGVVKAYGTEARDTFVVYPKGATVGIEEAAGALQGVQLRGDGLYVKGFTGKDVISVYTVEGRLVLQVRGTAERTACRFEAHTLYIVETSAGVGKYVVRE